MAATSLIRTTRPAHIIVEERQGALLRIKALAAEAEEEITHKRFAR